MSSKKDAHFFPWELYFSENEIELKNASKTCASYPASILKNAVLATNSKPGKNKQENCNIIIKSIHDLIKKNVKSLPVDEQTLALIDLKKQIKQRFFTLEGVQVATVGSRPTSPKVDNVDEKEDQEEKEAVRVGIHLLKLLLSEGSKTNFKVFKDSIGLTHFSNEQLKSIFDTLFTHYKDNTKHLKKYNDRKNWILSQIKELEENNNVSSLSKSTSKINKMDDEKDNTKIIKDFMSKKGWDDKNISNDELSEYLFEKLVDEEKDFKSNESNIHQELNRYNLLLAQTQSELSEQNKIVKQLKLIKDKDPSKLKDAENDLTRLRKDVTELKEKIKQFQDIVQYMEKSRSMRKKICNQLDYDEDIIDQAIIEDDLTCEKPSVCNLETNVCTDKKHLDGFAVPITIGDKVIELFPEDKAKELEEDISKRIQKNEYSSAPSFTSYPRFVKMQSEQEFYNEDQPTNLLKKESLTNEVKEEDEEEILENNEVEGTLEEQLEKLSKSRSLSKDEDSGMECFKMKNYETIDDLKEDLNCNEQICDINTHQCVDRFEEQNTSKIDNVDYTFNTNTNLDLISELKQKFKSSTVLSSSSTIKNIQAPTDIDVPVIDMEVAPAYLSEKVNLQSFTNMMQTIQAKPRLSIDQRFNNRTKARRDMIRKCLDLD